MIEAPQAPPIVVLAGPTCVGKTRVALELCKRFGGEIIGADSVQIYREFDIGSGKPTQAELGGVRHHMLDVLSPGEPIDAARFAALADTTIHDVSQRSATAFVVGGTGLWLRALLRGLVPLPAVDHGLRARLNDTWRELGPDAMHARLQTVDPLTAQHVHKSDMMRVVRALEIHAQTGRPLGVLRDQHAKGTPRYRSLTLVLDIPDERWIHALTERVTTMFACGWTDEVRHLLARYGPELRPLRSVGYRQIVEALTQNTGAAEMQTSVLRATRLYGKRQRTWFRTDPSVDQWLESDQVLTDAVCNRIAQHLAGSTG